MKQIRPYPRVVITKKGTHKLQSGHPWVFEGEVIRMEPSPIDQRAAINGDLVDVVTENDTYLGTGLLSEQSKIRVRIVSTNANDTFDEAFWARKIEWAWDYRRTVMGQRGLADTEPDTNCCRILFSEADGFPGLIVDRYEDVLVAQVGTVGMQRLRPVIYPLLVKTLREAGQTISGVFERNDSPSRVKEGLPLEKGWYPLEGIDTPHGDTKIVAVENGIKYEIDIMNSQKTGFFLDQKYNRRAVRNLAAGRKVLDCFCHVGTFGLNAMAGGAQYVRCVDISDTAIELARSNARLNGYENRMDFTCIDAKDYLTELASDRQKLREQGGPFDLIVLDPPAFTKNRSTIEHARHGYEEINYLAMRMLPRGGYLATCSCSHFMTADMLRAAIAKAAQRANVQLKMIEQRQQAPDHPMLWGVPETSYLDFFIFQVI